MVYDPDYRGTISAKRHQMNLDYNDGGEWFWRTNHVKRGYPAYWRNQGNGWGTGCIHYTRLTDCQGRRVGHDFAFALLGT